MPDQAVELSYEEFVRARKLYWQPDSNKSSAIGRAPAEPESASLVQDGSDVMLYSAGPQGIFAVFEDFSQKGWFYLYSATQQKILKSAYIYSHANVCVEEDVIDIGWASDDSCCGLAVWGEFRAFLGLSTDIHIEKPLTQPDEDGIPSTKWPAGFELYLEKKID